MTGVLVNGFKNVEDIPTAPPDNKLARHGEGWSYREICLLRILLPQYGLERTAWTLRRSAHSVQKMAVRHRISYAKRPPRPDTRGGVA